MEQTATITAWYNDYIAYEAIVHGGHRDNKNDGCYKSGHDSLLEWIADGGIPALLDALEEARTELNGRMQRKHDCKIECLLDAFNKVVAERDALIKALESICQNGGTGMCEFCGADCIDAGTDVDDTFQCGCFKWRGSEAQDA